MKKIYYLIVMNLMLSALISSGQTELPAIKGGWWQIAEREPDVSPWNNPGVHNACDFTIWQDDYETWHLVACIRSTTFPIITRLFHHWTSPSLTATMWTPAVHTNTFTTSNGVVTVTNGIFAVTQHSLGQYPGVMQAPHCVKLDGKYYFFYNSAYTNEAGARQNNSAYCKISDDGVNFTDATNTVGSYKFFDMGRDIFVMELPDNSWMSCFEYNGVMSTRTAPHPLGPWSEPAGVLGTSGNPESPYIVKRDGGYYLWEQMKVYFSTNPLSFTGSVLAELDAYQYAPEIFEYNGQYYMASYEPGVWLTRLDWMPTATSSADVTNMTVAALSYGSELIPRFNYYSTDYLIVEKYAKSSLTFTNTLRDTAAQLTMSVTSTNGTSAITVSTNASQQRVGTAPLAIGENIVKIQVTNGSDSQTYNIHITRKNAAGLDTVSAPILPESGLFVPGATGIALDTLSSLATIYYTLDGSAPTTNSLLYTGTITLASNATLRAAAFQDGLLSSSTAQQTMEAVYPATVAEDGRVGLAPILQWSSQAGCQYSLETSTNLFDWSSVGTFGGTGSSINYTSPAVSGPVFYRIKTTL